MRDKDLDILTACRNCPPKDLLWMFSKSEWESIRRQSPARSAAKRLAVAVLKLFPRDAKVHRKISRESREAIH